MPAELHLLRPLWLLALLPLLGLWVFLVRRRTLGQVWRPLVDPHLLPHLLVGAEGAARRLPLLLLGLGWLLAVLALGGPAWQRLPVPVFTVDAKRVILLDLSPSMNATDIPPSRLARARFEVLDLLKASREGQVALVAYGPEPFVISPLTGDAQTIADQVPRLTSDLIPVPGPRRTDLALEAAGDLLAAAAGGPGEVILISDGVTGALGGGGADQARAVAAARALAEAGHRLSVLAIGTGSGAPVPGATGGFASDSGGSIQLSRLDRLGLQVLARAGGGDLVVFDAGDADTQALVSDPLGAQSRVAAQAGLTADQWREEGPWLLLALLPLAALAFRRGWLLPAFVCFALVPPTPGWALDWDALWQRPDQRAAQAFAAGDHQGASSTFEDPGWRAAARYRAGDYGGALEDLSGLAGAESDYNKGNALARLGRLDDAISAYERALKQKPDLEDAQANLELLRRLKEQRGQEQQGRQDQGQSGQEGQESQSGGQGQGSQGGQSQSTQGEDDQTPGQGSKHAQGSQGGGEPGASDASSPASGGQSATQTGDQRQAGQGARPEGAEQAETDSAPGGGEQGAEPSAADLGQGSVGGGPQPDLQTDPDGRVGSEAGRAGDGPRPDGGPSGPGAGSADLTPGERERRQALEAQLRRVPDDPAGLLRQRFILQHLRREGRLP